MNIGQIDPHGTAHEPAQKNTGIVTRTGGVGERKGRGTDIKATQQGNYTAETQTPSFYVFE